jgi:hypothetical protein
MASANAIDETQAIEHAKPGPSPIVVAPTPENAGFLGAVIRFPDDSHWKLTAALSCTKYQDSDPPYEAVQVFACTCLQDPSHNYEGVEEAVVKVKYQYKTMSLHLIHTF